MTKKITIKKFESFTEEQLKDSDFMQTQKQLYMERYPERFDELPDYKSIVKVVNALKKPIKEQAWREWKKIPLSERRDIESMQVVQDLMVEEEVNKDDYTFIQVSNAITKLEIEKEKKLAKVDKAQDLLTRGGLEDAQHEAMLADAIEKYEEIVVNKDIYFIADTHEYHEYHSDGVWKAYPERSIYKMYQCYKGYQQEAFNTALTNMGRVKSEAVWSFRQHPQRVLNKLNNAGWLKPLDDGVAYPKVIAYMLLAMSGDRIEVIDHIEQVFYWKMTHPEDYKIPCLSIHGVGGLSKNTFVDMVLKPIFGEDQVTTVSMETIEKYTTRIVGKAVVFIDENDISKNAAGRVKSLVGNRKMDLDGKWVTQKEVDSTAMFMTGGNDNLGSFLLDGTDADRRWSIIKSSTSYKDIVCKYEGFEMDSPELIEFLDDGLSVLADHDNIARWVAYLLERWKDLKYCPRGLHQEDYKKLIELQEQSDQAVFRIIFGHKNFTWIRNTTLWQCYELYHKASGGRDKLGKNQFLAGAEAWLDSHGKDINVVRGKWQVVDNGKKTRPHMFAVSGVFNIEGFDNTINADEKYIEINDYGKPVMASNWAEDEDVEDDGEYVVNKKLEMQTVIKFPKM